MPVASLLASRSIIRASGADRQAFFQALISNDITRIAPNRAIYAALLTPQGKFLHDMFISVEKEAYLIDCEAARRDDLIKRFTHYRLRSKVVFEDLSALFDVWAIWGEDAHVNVLPFTCCYPDPRLRDLGQRTVIEKNKTPATVAPVDFSCYDGHRLQQGVADGSRDLEIEKSTLAEGNFDYLNGIDWKKGCYIGQELTARMHYRGLVKKRLFPVRIAGATPPLGHAIGDAGELRSVCGDRGLALLRIDAVQECLVRKNPLQCGETLLWPSVPGWLKPAMSTTV